MGFNKTLSRILTIGTFYAALTACSTQPTVDSDLPEEEYYRKAQEALDNDLPQDMLNLLETLESDLHNGGENDYML